ncbi:MAG TPA: phage holin family protein [Thermoleophilaceae bacterium]|nr:phage holin family protein [Thermoleophilaceae bacterium]
MTPSNADKSLGEIVSDVSEKASLLVREEIELAKSEVLGKAKKMARGAGVGAAAGVFLVFALVMFLHTLAWFLYDVFDLRVWVAFGIVTLLLVLLAAIAGFLAAKWLKAGPPTPDMAIEQAKLTRQTLEHQAVERDQLERSLEHTKETDKAAAKQADGGAATPDTTASGTQPGASTSGEPAAIAASKLEQTGSKESS